MFAVTSQFYFGSIDPAYCDLPGFFFDLNRCMKQQDFINCPPDLQVNFTSYEAMREYFEIKKENNECGYKIGDFYFIDESFWKPL